MDLILGTMMEIDCDAGGKILGRLSGTATSISPNGTVHNMLVISPEQQYRGYFSADESFPASYISEILVDPDNARPAPIYVNVYQLDRLYGGPEEGGWWYDNLTPVVVERAVATDDEILHSYLCKDEEEARSLQAIMLEQFPSTGNSNSVLGGEDYRVLIQYHPAEVYPKSIPHYE